MNTEDILRIATAGLELIVTLLGERTPKALDAADDAARALLEGLKRQTTLEVVEADLNALREGIATNDAAADKALRDKFDTSETE